MAAEISTEFTKQNGQHPRVSEDPRKWVDEGGQLAIHGVYTFGPDTGSRDQPLSLTEEYQSNVHSLARTRLALAGFRLAAVLNDRFK